jgi:hypothetical protein
MLASEWLPESGQTTEERAYFVDKLLPTLVLGLEQLLKAAEKKGAIAPADENDIDAGFNPVNFLAQYLMRHNPKFSGPNEVSLGGQ